MKNGISFSILSLLLLGIACLSEARVDSLTGGLDVALDIDRRTNKSNSESTTTSTTTLDEDYNKLVTTPFLRFTSKDVKDSIDFKYAPGLKYDLDGKGNKVDHRLDLSVQRSLVKEWQIKISDLYINTDDSTQTLSASNGDTASEGTANTSTDQISNELGRRRFWNNNASFLSNYTYLQDSLLTLGYTYSVLRNDETGTSVTGGYQDYDKHEGLLSVSYSLNPEWKTIFGGKYIRGLYDVQESSTTALSSDLVQYLGNMTLESYIFAKNTLSASYEYLGTKYDETTRNDNDIHQGTLGWKQEVSPRMKFDLGGGPSSVKTETQEAKWGYNAHANVNYLITEHGKFDFGVKKGFSQDNFSGTSTGGFIDSWQLNGGFGYALYKDLSCRLFASYKDEDHQNGVAASSTSTGESTVTSTQDSNQDTYNKKIYESGLKLTYKFWELYTATAGYTFSRQDSDGSQAVNFDEHRFYLSLGFQNELLRW
jgi:hypothetical protein